jgi:hypothetical protein
VNRVPARGGGQEATLGEFDVSFKNALRLLLVSPARTFAFKTRGFIRLHRCVLWAVLLAFAPATALAQLSPGPLSKSHSSLEGTFQCVKCHALGTGRPQLKCSSCHAPIADRVQNNQGYHARIVDRAKGDADCARCHAEHAGPEADLIRWQSSQSSFNHAQAGYRLEGKHASLQCNQCHKSASFLGLQTQCLSCHQDNHRGQLGSDCTSCHTQESWKTVSKFNHKLTHFPLTGLHATVACERCHTPAQSGGPARYKDLAFSECSSCHRDPHQGAFKAACSQCHNTSGWRTTDTTLSANFDHSKTPYPLTGRHALVPCRSCHKTSNFSTPIATARCTDCHADKHTGQFAKRADRGDCVGCHTVAGFKPSTFDITSHAQTRYPLAGKHSLVACDKCHAAKDESTNYYPPSGTCVNCHRDAHVGQFKERFLDKCESCHRVEGFAPSTFTLARHREARFTLAGAHAAVPCSDCHRQNRERDPHQYQFADMSCTGCHADPHDLSVQRKGCESCHTERSWKTVRSFDHATTRFPLLGLHRSVPCVECHKREKSAAGERLPFGSTPQACSGCHEDEHAGQFAISKGAADCNSCHQLSGWKPAVFDHNSSAFPLDGRHRSVPCSSCHIQRSSIRGRLVVVYSNAPKECSGCH